MRPLTIEFCGINSFSERAEIDFTALSEYGIFGIFGDTGSGKSTVLDCIAFALYGDVTRSKGSLAEIINYRSEKAFVNFEFAAVYEGARRTFRVERELKRKNAVQTVRVYERRGGALAALSEGVRESNALLTAVVGLEQKDFEKCIALPQGEFAQFVRAPRAERLKLISRLFDLEKYGEGLIRRTNVKFATLREETSVLKARLEPLEQVTAESNRLLKEEISRLEAEETSREQAVKAAREAERALSAAREKRQERDRLAAEMQKLEEVRAAMATLNSELLRLEKAAVAVTAADGERESAEKLRRADAALESAVVRELQALKTAESYSDADAEKLGTEIERLSALAFESKNAEIARKEYAALLQKFDDVQKRQSAERSQFADFCYEEEHKNIESRLRAAGEEQDFFTFAEQFGKAALLRGEYRIFADELDALLQKHAEIGADVRPLIGKYRTLSEGGTTDFPKLRAAYEEQKREREAARDALVLLEKRKSRYDVHLNALQTLETERKELSERLKKLAPQFEGKEPYDKIQSLLDEKRGEKRQFETRRMQAAEQLRSVAAEKAAASERVIAAKAAAETAQTRLKEALSAGEFSSVQEAEALNGKYGDPAAARQRVEAYKERYAAVKSRLRELCAEDLDGATEQAARECKARLEGLEQEFRDCARTLAVRRDALVRAERDLAAKREIEAEYRKSRAQTELYERLKKLLEGNKFMEFAAEEYLQTVARNASGRLLSLTDGRYFLRYEGGFLVGDNFDGGNARAVSTLSGGETFLVSLSLALSLGAEICARSMRPIEFFFLDEGFGTLDEKLVDTVMDSLEKLKSEHFTIGIISHVEELKHRIERKLIVKKATENRGSQIIAE